MGRTGTFICIHAQLERLKTEGVVDFFQFTKSARMQRAGLITDAVSTSIIKVFVTIHHHAVFVYIYPTCTHKLKAQYVLCHDVVANYLDSFDTYANFKEVV